MTSTLDDIPDEQIDIAFKQFSRKLEQYELNTKDSKEIIKDFLDKEKGLYNGVEVVMHSICCAAIKV